MYTLLIQYYYIVMFHDIMRIYIIYLMANQKLHDVGFCKLIVVHSLLLHHIVYKHKLVCRQSNHAHNILTACALKFRQLHLVAYLYILWMKTIHYPNKIRYHLVTIVPMAPFTGKSTSKLRSDLHFNYSIVIPCFIPYR